MPLSVPPHPYGSVVVTTTTVVVVVGGGVTTSVTVIGGGVGSVAVGVGVKAVAAQGVPTNMKPVVIVIQASCDCSDISAIAMLWAAARSSVVK